MEVTKKVCSRCQRELPITDFNASKHSPDGYQYYCKECQAEASRVAYVRRRHSSVDKTEQQDGMNKVFTKPELASFTPRQLMEELKARGFRWEYMLEPQRKIFYEKI